MAPLQVSDNPRVQEHYVAQSGLIELLLAALRKLWPTLDRNNLKQTQPVYIAQVAALVQQYARGSIELSALHFEDERRHAGVTGTFRTPIVDPPPFEQIESSVKWATEALWSPPKVDVKPDVVDVPEVDAPSLEDIETSVKDKLEGAVGKLVADSGRNQMMEAIEADTKTRGFARITKPGACAFCMMLATRGAVYKSKESAGFVPIPKGDPRSNINRYHNDDRCTVQAVYSDHFEASAAVREAQQLWLDSTKHARGSKAKQKAFRRAYEGRTDGPQRASKSTGKTRVTTNSSRKTANVFDPTRDVDAGQTTEQLKVTLAGLVTASKKFTSPGIEKRIAELRRKIAERD